MRHMNLLSALTLTLQYSTLGYRARSRSSNLGAVSTDRQTDRQTDLDAFTHALESRDELRARAGFLRQTVNQLRQLRLQTTTFAPTSATPTPPTTPSLTRCRPGAGETICPPRRWQFGGGKNRGGSTSVRGRVRSPHISGARRWLSCRQPACLSPRQLRHGTDRRTDRGIA